MISHLNITYEVLIIISGLTG